MRVPSSRTSSPPGNDDRGIWVSGSNNKLLNVTAVESGEDGILIEGYNNQVKDSYVKRAEMGIGIIGKNNTIITNTVENIESSCLVVMRESVGNVLKNNTLRRCRFGVFSHGIGKTIIVDNKIHSTGMASIEVSGTVSDDPDEDDAPATDIRITGNRITKSGADGIVLSFAHNAVVASNVIVDSGSNGIVLDSSSTRCRFKSNTVRKCGKVGIWIKGADGNNVTSNKVSFCRTGISAGLGSNRNRLINNRASNNTVFDLSDLSTNCGSNAWKGNTGKGNVACTQKK